jgi:hypothetical protein
MMLTLSEWMLSRGKLCQYHAMVMPDSVVCLDCIAEPERATVVANRNDEYLYCDTCGRRIPAKSDRTQAR